MCAFLTPLKNDKLYEQIYYPRTVDRTGKFAKIIAKLCDESNDSAQAQAGQEKESSVMDDNSAPYIYFAHSVQQECITGQETQIAQDSYDDEDLAVPYLPPYYPNFYNNYMTSKALENPEYWEVTKHQPESQHATFKYPNTASTSTTQCPAPYQMPSTSASWFEYCFLRTH